MVTSIAKYAKRNALMTATKKPSFTRAACNLRILDNGTGTRPPQDRGQAQGNHARRGGHKSMRKKIIGPAAMQNKQIQSKARIEIHTTYPTNAAMER